MQFNSNSFSADSPESWLIILIYAVFWGCSYYSLINLLIYTYQSKNSLEESEQPLEITS